MFCSPASPVWPSPKPSTVVVRDGRNQITFNVTPTREAFMKIGLHIPDFTWTGGDAVIGPKLAEVARTADEAGFDQISVMDHFFQIHYQGPAEHPMLEAYTALGFLAA